ncbi:MAG: hypothetical protein Q8P23_01285 [bacterium]|nr:hypothetical protein [bacterium]
MIISDLLTAAQIGDRVRVEKNEMVFWGKITGLYVRIEVDESDCPVIAGTHQKWLPGYSEYVNVTNRIEQA